MKNSYTVCGDYVEIELCSKKHGKQVTTISTEDLPLVDSFPNTWYPKWSSHGRTFYVVGNLPMKEGKRSSVKLHRWIMKPEQHLQVDHINHNTLDNRRINLRNITPSENQMNRKGSNKGNQTGVPGVSFRTKSGTYRARVYKGGRALFDKTFETLEDAKQAVELVKRIEETIKCRIE